MSDLFGKRNGFKRWNRTFGLLATEIISLWTSSKELWRKSENEINTKCFAHKEICSNYTSNGRFSRKWQQILYDAEKNLAELLRYEVSQVVAKIQIDLDTEIRKINPNNYNQMYTVTKQKYYKYRQRLEVKRSKKWKNVREKRRGLIYQRHMRFS